MPWIDSENGRENALIQRKGYQQQLMSDTSYSTVERTLDSGLRSRFLYRQLREIIRSFTLNNLKKLAQTL